MKATLINAISIMGITGCGIPCGLKPQASNKPKFIKAYIQSNGLVMEGFFIKNIMGNKIGKAQITFMFFSVTP